MARRTVVAIALLVSSVPLAQTAYDRGFDTVPTKVTPAANSGIALEGAVLPSKHSQHGQALLDANVGILALKLGEQKLGDLIPFRLDAHALLAYQLLDRLEIAGDLPLTIYQWDNFQLLRDQGFGSPGVSAVGLGSIRVIPRYALLTPEQFFIPLAIVAELRAPSPSGAAFLGDRGPVFAPRLAAERSFGPVRVLANLGVRLRAPTQYLNLYVGQEMTFGAGAVVSLPNILRLTQLTAIGELHLATPLEEPFNFSHADSLKTPFELLAGLRGRVYDRWSAEVDIGKGMGIESGYGRETFRVMASARYDFEPERRVVPVTKGDRDGDGVPDSEDLCPDQPGPKEYDGCPDRDGDGVPDNIDKCPDQPGPVENEGCPTEEPQVVLETNRIKIKTNILFETGSAVIQRQSYKLLDEVYGVLAKHPEIGKVRVEGHTDNRGAREYNLDLSQRRAKSVVDYLVKKGIPSPRLTARGYGFDRPVATNATPLGRAKNRRVEFNIVDEDEGPKKKALEIPQEKQGELRQVTPGSDGGVVVQPAPSSSQTLPADAGTARDAGARRK